MSAPFDPNRTQIGGPQAYDPNRTVLGTPQGDPNRTVLGAPPMGADPNRTAAWSPVAPLSFTLTPSRAATMANGPAREQFLLEINAPRDPGLPGMNTSGARAPLNLCLVLDRSGSMEGAPIEYAKQACAQIVDLLSPNDVLSIVVFDEIVEVLMPPQRVTDKAMVKQGLNQITPGYTTNLYDGLTLGAQQLGMTESTGRVTRMIVLSDGDPTAGIKDFSSLVSHAGDIKQRGIGVTFLGFGPDYNEELLASMAKKAAGSYHYIAQPHQIPEVFRDEFTKLVSTAGTNLKLEFKTARWVELMSCTGLNGPLNGTDFTVDLADVEQGSTIQVLLDMEFRNHPLGWYRVASGKIHFDPVGAPRQTVEVDFVMEFTAEAARYGAPADPRVTAVAQVATASRAVEKTMLGLKTQAITAAVALQELQKTQALLLQDGRVTEAREVTMAMQAIQSGDTGAANKTLMGTMVQLDQGKKS